VALDDALHDGSERINYEFADGAKYGLEITDQAYVIFWPSEPDYYVNGACDLYVRCRVCDFKGCVVLYAHGLGDLTLSDSASVRLAPVDLTVEDAPRSGVSTTARSTS